MIEVERKFLVSSTILQNLQQKAESTKMSEHVIHDVYYDTTTNVLMSHDMWLRLRNGIWQLKYRLGSGIACVSESGVQSMTTQYLETENEDEIANVTAPVLPEGAARKWSLAELVEDGVLVVVMDFKSCRRSFRIGHLTVDVDEADFGFSVGEIEVLVENESDVPDAIRDIDDLGHQLGVSSWTCEGKVDNYLARNNVSLLVHLREVGIFKTPSDADH